MNDNYREKFFSFLLKKTCTSKQAEEFLLRSKFPHEIIAPLISEAQDMGLIDDLTFAKLFIEGHLHWGNAKIIYELSSKGITKQKIYEALEDSEDENSRAYKLFETFKKQGLEDKKIMNRLLSRGFSLKSINSCRR